MSISNRSRLLNLSLRTMTLVSRFLFVFCLARFVDSSFVGLYGLFTAAVGYALYFLGLDFYTYSNREILKLEKDAWGRPLKNQLALTAVLYAIFLPLSMGLFVFGALPLHMLPWFVLILVCEHVNQELGRLLNAISEQLLASLALFVRQGVWAIGVVALMALDKNTRTLDYIFGAWAISGVLAALVAIRRLQQLNIGGWQAAIDWQWVIKGLKICIPLLMATLALRGVTIFDRYWLQALSGIHLVGAYVLFVGVSGSLMVFLDAGIFAYGYPLLIRTFQKGNTTEFRRGWQKMLWQTLGFCLLFAAGSILMLPNLLRLIGNPFYSEYSFLYPWLLLATIMNALSMIPHFALYAQGHDRPIITSHLGCLALFVVVTWLLSNVWPLLAVPVGLCITYAFIFIWKTVAFFRRSAPAFCRVQAI